MHDIRKILSSINDAVWSFDLLTNKFIYYNNRLAELYETPLTEIEENASFWLKYIHPDDFEYTITETKPAYTGKNVEVEYRLLINNEVKWVLDKKVVLLDSENQPIAITAILSDITEKKLVESHLTDSQKTYRYLFINNPNPLWIYDIKTLQFLAVNNAAVAKYGYSKEEFLAMTIADIRPKEDLSELITHVNRINDTYIALDKCWRHLKKNGEVLYVNISGHGIKHNGHDAEIIMAHDITVEVENRKRIMLAKENLDTLINNIKEDIWSIDVNYNIISANDSFNRTIKNAIGKEIQIGESVFYKGFDNEEVSQWKRYYDKALRGESFTFTEFVKLPGVDPFCAETRMNPIKNGNQIIGVACISSNIQERIKNHAQIVQQNKNLREVISLASHEIRGPVASLLGLLSAFNTDNPTDPFNKEVLQLISSVTKNLDQVLHKLVDKSYMLRTQNEITNVAPHNLSERG